MSFPASQSLVRALQHSDREVLRSSLASTVVFNSPVATYRGRDDVVHLLVIIGDVVERLTVTGEFAAGSQTVTLVSGHVGQDQVDGALVQVANDDGLVARLTLMLRPLSGLLEGVDRMGQRLAAEPLPSEGGRQ